MKIENSNETVVLLSTAYLAPIEYYSKILNYNNIYIEKFENYTKQTYRNRCVIYGANGPLSLIIPIKKNSSVKTLIKDIKIDYSMNWQRVHLMSIESAYNSSPFYQYFINELLPFYFKNYSFLIDFNTELQKIILNIININKSINYTKEYIRTPDDNTYDFRQLIHPKKKFHIRNDNFITNEYYQVFSNKFGFIPNLSIIDLLFNTGNNTITCL